MLFPCLDALNAPLEFPAERYQDAAWSQSGDEDLRTALPQRKLRRKYRHTTLKTAMNLITVFRLVDLVQL